MTDCVNKIVTKGVMYGYVRLKVTENADKTQYSWSVWTVFVQSSEGHDMRPYVDHVTFCLNNDFPDNVRTVYDPPYEVSQFGALNTYSYIYVFFRDAVVPPQFFYVYIDCESELYRKQVKYDNLVFVRPNLAFYKKLQVIAPATKHSGVLHHIDPDAFRRLYPQAAVCKYKAAASVDELRREMQAAEQDNTAEGAGCYIIEPVRQEKGADKVIEQCK